MSDAPHLFTRHRPIALAIATQYRLPGFDQDDARQEALIALWRAARNWDRARGPFPPYARMCIHKHLETKLRNARRHKQLVLTDAVRELEASTTDDADDLIDRRDTVRQLSAAINRLPAFQRHCVIAFHYEGRTYRQIGDRKRVDNALQDARRALRAA